MRLFSTVQLALAENEIFPIESAREMLGRETPTSVEGVPVGSSKITAVDWREKNEVWVTMELDVEDMNVIAKLICGPQRWSIG